VRFLSKRSAAAPLPVGAPVLAPLLELRVDPELPADAGSLAGAVEPLCVAVVLAGVVEPLSVAVALVGEFAPLSVAASLVGVVEPPQDASSSTVA
jgi:hypothetical protein